MSSCFLPINLKQCCTVQSQPESRSRSHFHLKTIFTMQPSTTALYSPSFSWRNGVHLPTQAQGGRTRRGSPN
nr:MAG TPA: hypothetical protein [Caudoviricetes sp.]